MLCWAFPCSISTLVLEGGDSTPLTDEASDPRPTLTQVWRGRAQASRPCLSFLPELEGQGRAGPRGRVCLVGTQLNEV